MKIFIIPGGGENTDLKSYKDLIRGLRNLGYTVVSINPKWELPLSKQIFKVGKNDIVFGFSRGALLAYMVTKKYPCKSVILASMTPLRNFSKKAIYNYYGKESADNLLKIKFVGNKTPKVHIAGELEEIKADIYVPRTGHHLTKSYIKYIINLLKNKGD
ncbi:MAG: hypothetical protein AAB758_01595 [Patescibacteria group bacterium]